MCSTVEASPSVVGSGTVKSGSEGGMGVKSSDKLRCGESDMARRVRPKVGER